ncbi:hypothetical protein [Halobacterium jilantaiense]|uniref:Uncharacterized protein n=1 Tax=Halobacterium jilantaiense TaxID=355548 RepID=A0A1I0QPS3_9EURY|nr:hypothetical protein [Halobacterium jilantaiense]SEW29302.1 hypothetical protein SAMN04487945_2816 [Halobacterium jilantaiense]
MKRRRVLASAVGAVSLTGGCLWDRTNDGSITIAASEIPCNEATIDVNVDTRDISRAVEQIADELVTEGEYTATPPYDSATMTFYDMLWNSSGGNDATVKHDGTCYDVTVQRIFDE